MADIFLSYASEDRARIEPLVRQLESAGYSVWWDRDLKGGMQFSRRIEQEVIEAKVVLVAWSPAAIESRWVADEAELALETGNILPITLDGARSPMGFRQLQTIDFSGWKGRDDPCVLLLLEALSHHLKDGSRTLRGAVALPASSQVKSDASIAVLPFVNMSSDLEQDYFADGISEELLNLLSRIKELAVVARTSAFSFKGSDKSIAQIGESLGVAYILEGSVRKSGARVRITAQLIEVATGFHMWSESFDRTLDDIFAVQDEISAAIVEALREYILGGDEIRAPVSARAADMGAYDLYLLGQKYMNERSRSALEIARGHLEEAHKIEASFVPTLTALAETHLLLSNSPICYGTNSVDEASRAALPLLQCALELEPDCAEAFVGLSLYHYVNYDFEAAKSAALRASNINPNLGRAYTTLSMAFVASGDPTAPIIATCSKALSLDPLHIGTLPHSASQYLLRMQPEKALDLYDRLETIAPGHPMLVWGPSWALASQGRLKDALAILLGQPEPFEQMFTTFLIQQILSQLGYAEATGMFAPTVALEYYAADRNHESARRVAERYFAEEASVEDVYGNVARARWLDLEGNVEEALALISVYDERDPDKWGVHFNCDFACTGGRLSLYLRRKLGKKISSQLYLEKMRLAYQSMIEEPDKKIYLADFLGAVVATVDGDIPGALDCLEQQIDRTMMLAGFFLKDPLLEPLYTEPRYKTLCEKVDAHLANERAAAEAAGLLPVPEALLAPLKEV